MRFKKNWKIVKKSFYKKIVNKEFGRFSFVTRIKSAFKSENLAAFKF